MVYFLGKWRSGGEEMCIDCISGVVRKWGRDKGMSEMAFLDLLILCYLKILRVEGEWIG